MSEAIDRILDLRRTGFGFLHHHDENGQVIAVQAVRVRAGHIETVLIHGEHDALAARCRDDDHAAVLWHPTGTTTTTDVITALLDVARPARPGDPACPGIRPDQASRPLAPDRWLVC